MRLLALDAALAQCSAAVMQNGECLGLAVAPSSAAPISRSAIWALPGLVQDLLRELGPAFDAVAVAVGPGSFTGLRGSLALAHGLALGRAVPIVGVSVPEALLQQAGPQLGRAIEAVWIAIDAKRAGRIFLARGDTITAVSLDDLPLPSSPVTVLGDAADQTAAALRDRGVDAIAGKIQSITAADTGLVALRRLAGELHAREAQPLYIEPPQARPAANLRPAPV